MPNRRAASVTWWPCSVTRATASRLNDSSYCFLVCFSAFIIHLVWVVYSLNKVSGISRPLQPLLMLLGLTLIVHSRHLAQRLFKQGSVGALLKFFFQCLDFIMQRDIFYLYLRNAFLKFRIFLFEFSNKLLVIRAQVLMWRIANAHRNEDA